MKPSSPARFRIESGQRFSSHSNRWGVHSFSTQALHRLAQLLVLVGEDEVLAVGAVIGLDDAGGRGRHVLVSLSVADCSAVASVGEAPQSE